jgi:hypothetical protein
MMDNNTAIFKLNLSVVTIRGDIAYDANGNIVEYDQDAVQAYVDSHAYIAKRQAEYPSLADFADAYYWMQKGQTDLMDEYVAKCDAVKNKFPKETT